MMIQLSRRLGSRANIFLFQMIQRDLVTLFVNLRYNSRSTHLYMYLLKLIESSNLEIRTHICPNFNKKI